MISVSRVKELHESIHGEAERLEPIIDERLILSKNWRQTLVRLPWGISEEVADVIRRRYESVGWRVLFHYSIYGIVSLEFHADSSEA